MQLHLPLLVQAPKLPQKKPLDLQSEGKVQRATQPLLFATAESSDHRIKLTCPRWNCKNSVRLGLSGGFSTSELPLSGDVTIQSGKVPRLGCPSVVSMNPFLLLRSTLTLPLCE